MFLYEKCGVFLHASYRGGTYTQGDGSARPALGTALRLYIYIFIKILLCAGPRFQRPDGFCFVFCRTWATRCGPRMRTRPTGWTASTGGLTRTWFYTTVWWPTRCWETHRSRPNTRTVPHMGPGNRWTTSRSVSHVPSAYCHVLFTNKLQYISTCNNFVRDCVFFQLVALQSCESKHKIRFMSFGIQIKIFLPYFRIFLSVSGFRAYFTISMLCFGFFNAYWGLS